MRSRFYSLAIVPLLVLIAVSEPAGATDREGLDQRSFHLGFTPFAYDLTIEAVETTYRLTGANSDIVAHHFDGGVPWPEAEFVIWFVPIDYDLLWDRLEDQGVDEFYKLWRDCGLWDGALNPRTSLLMWRQWLQRGRVGPGKGNHE